MDTEVFMFRTTLLLIVGLALGCARIAPIREESYMVVVVNVGKAKIEVGDVALCVGDRDGSAVVGYLWPGQQKGTGPFHCLPSGDVQIQWRVVSSGDSCTSTVTLLAPEAFRGQDAARMIFLIDPESGAVVVQYELRGGQVLGN